jgi:protein-S-isoprenylcysteine O-methyltransferase Ste14
MSLAYRYLFPALWLSWAAYWWIRSLDVKTAVRREPLGSRLLHIVPLVLSALLLWPDRFAVPILGDSFLTRAPWSFWTGAALTCGGLLFTVWARVHIGRNWSGTVTVKEDHQLVTSGPYALVRHPIYSGLLLGFIGSALARGEWRGVLAVALAIWALWRKLRVEEAWMQEQFGERYRIYARRVAALIPFLL